MPGGRILLVSGGRGAGKTRLCLRLRQQAAGLGLAAAGVICPGRFVPGPVQGLSKTGIYVQAVRSGEQRLLASNQAGELHGLQLGSWTFDDAVLLWGAQVLAQAYPCELLFVDELGPLEFEQQRGWSTAFAVLAAGDFRLALVVVRPECLAQAHDLWPAADTVLAGADLDLPQLLH